MKDFICRGCGYTWSMAEDEDGLFNGYGVPPCPICGDSGCDLNDYRTIPANIADISGVSTEMVG